MVERKINTILIFDWKTEKCRLKSAKLKLKNLKGTEIPIRVSIDVVTPEVTDYHAHGKIVLSTAQMADITIQALQDSINIDEKVKK